MGDVNGDGFSDFIIATHLSDNNTGKIYLFLGKSSGWQKLIYLSDAKAPGDSAGFTVSAVGDINKDGFDDFLISAPQHDYIHSETGKVYLILGKATGWVKNDSLKNASISFVGDSTWDRVGLSIGGIGDINGDGFDDYAIGAPYHLDYDQPSYNGTVYLFFGKGTLPWGQNENVSFADASLIGKNKDDFLGVSISNTGDINNDGKNDFMISASSVNVVGKAYLIFGKSSGWTHNLIVETFAPSFIGENEYSNSGNPSWLSDLNGDGYCDLLIAAPQNSHIQNFAGKVSYIPGKSNGWSQNINLSTVNAFMFGENKNDYAGYAISTGDFNRDGYPDIAVSAPGCDEGGTDAGIVYLYQNPMNTSASLSLISPDGGENWSVGNSYEIKWFSTGNIENVKLSYSTDHGASWTTIIDHTSNKGVYPWTIPNNSSASCLVKINYVDDESILDMSREVFTISRITETLTVTSANGGEALIASEQFPITWTWNGNFQKVKIEYSVDSGLTWDIIDSYAENNGKHDWTVPNTPSNLCLVRILEKEDGYPADTSDNIFSISSLIIENLTIISPNGGESLTVGEQFTITWNWEGNFQKVEIEYSVNNGQTWNLIDNCVKNSGKYDWTVPNTPSDACLVRISEKEDKIPVDTSNALFSIIPQESIEITEPNGDECILPGSEYKIMWNSSCKIDSVRIEYSNNGGTGWITIADSILNTGCYLWTIPSTNSKKCLIKIIDIDGFPQDMSNGYFTIYSEDYMVLHTPNGGECLIAGDKYEISWSACCIYDEVKLKYSTDNDAHWTCITTTANDGSSMDRA